MKNLIIKLLVVVVAITLTTNLLAAHPSTVVKETVITNPTIFVEMQAMNTTIDESILCLDVMNLLFLNLEERHMKVIVEDSKSNQTASAIVVVKTLDGSTELGPYTVTEGVILEVVVDQYEWVVQVEECSDEAIVTHWY